jgi:hypothetical protein
MDAFSGALLHVSRQVEFPHIRHILRYTNEPSTFRNGLSQADDPSSHIEQ